MKTVKMSLANMQGKMSRKELKNIMAGSYFSCGGTCTTNFDCSSGDCCGCGSPGTTPKTCGKC